MSSFTDPDAVARYADGPFRQVPGLAHLHRMTAILLAESAGPQARVLVLGAGGGLELKALAQAQPGWRLLGIDPSAEMLDLARQSLGPLVERVDFFTGRIDDAPAVSCDAATCLLTLHFLTEAERRHTLAELRRRLRPGAPLVIAHHSFPRSEAETERWLRRYAAFSAASGIPAAQADNAAQAIKARLPVLAPVDEERLLVEAGFADIELFYAGFSFRGWVARTI